MENIYFRTSDLTVGYNKKPLIKDINIDVDFGEIVTMIGPNGAGKSTILKSITKHLEMVGGEAFIADVSLAHLSFKALAQQMSVVLTEKIKGELLTCYDVVATGRYPYTNSLGVLDEKDRVKVSEAMKKAHVEELAGRDFSAISDGQRQRVLLARAICQEPKIIVLDEPTSFLDVKHKLELLNILHTMAKKENIAVLMSLHEIDLAQKISDKVICVHGDSIEHFGRPNDIFTDEIIRELYSIEKGSYNITFGSVELPKPVGEPEVFVIAGNGKGIPVFREMTRLGIPFCTGILHENDVDFYVAKNLASDLISVPAFEEISEESLEKALKAIKKCRRVILANDKIGLSNKRVATLIECVSRLNLHCLWTSKRISSGKTTLRIILAGKTMLSTHGIWLLWPIFLESMQTRI